MFESIHGGSLNLSVIPLHGTSCFAASITVLETLSVISSVLFAADKKIQSFSLRSRLYMLYSPLSDVKPYMSFNCFWIGFLNF